MGYLLLFLSAVFYLTGLRVLAALLIFWEAISFLRSYMAEAPGTEVQLVDRKRLAELCKGPANQAESMPGTPGGTPLPSIPSGWTGGPAKFHALKEPSFGSSKLRAVLYRPVEQTPYGHVGIIFTHPWAMMGGDMNNNVPSVLAHTFAQLGFTTAKFNFRGLGLSRGWSEFTDCQDMALALKQLQADERYPHKVERVIVVGYSHGSISASAAGGSLSEFAAFVSLSPPLAFMQLLTLFNGNAMKNKARASSKPKLWVCGDQDSFTDKSSFLTEASLLQQPRQIVLIEGADHFWFGTEKALASVIFNWLLHHHETLLCPSDAKSTSGSSPQKPVKIIKSAAGRAVAAALLNPLGPDNEDVEDAFTSL
eukprot:gb/GEZN01008580.1/.p1 GENE.gb/GEZN01008580.1/~~gb/GEZN01008580.1/.p1  ORF type:complete len:366 (+),score=57.27 gb/GEZN01008580.1/:58-1155(+)